MIVVYTRSPNNDIETMVKVVLVNCIVRFLDGLKNQSCANNLRKKALESNTAFENYIATLLGTGLLTLTEITS